MGLGRLILHTPDAEECILIPGFFGLALQFLLGIFAFSSLVYKRYCEKPQRPWKTFLMDTSKQLCSAFFIHFINIAGASYLSKEIGDACDWYLVTLLADVTIGLFLCILLLKLSQKVFSYHTGEYSNYHSWLYQLMIFIGVQFVAKAMVFVLMILFPNFFVTVVNKFFTAYAFEDEIKLVLVMIVVPTALNIFQLWMLDGYLKLRAAPVEKLGDVKSDVEEGTHLISTDDEMQRPSIEMGADRRLEDDGL